MRHKSGTRGPGSEQMICTIKRKTRRQYSAEEKIASQSRAAVKAFRRACIKMVERIYGDR